ncbi:serine/threonine protein kinase, AGC family [Bisporella sp. PMI_857]|nr:serine/threonine protein kinase, AGC family [Bisporella sp. PMI_857]
MPIQIASESGFKEAVTLITTYQKTELPSTPILAPKGLLNIKIVEARGLRKCREPYIVAVFQKNELVSKVGYEDGTGEDGRESPIAGIPIGRSGSDNGRSPFAMTLRSRQSSNGSVASLGDYRTVKLGAVNKLMTRPKWDIEAVFDVVRSDSLLDISIYDRGTTNQEFIGRVSLEPILLEVGDTSVRGWYPLKGYSNDENALGEIYVETAFQATEKKHYGPNDFQILKLIGKGTSGQVYQVRKKGTKRIYAMKVLPKKVIVQEAAHTVGEQNILARRAIADSPFIVGLKFSFQTLTDLYLIADYMSGGELFWHLQKEGRFNEMRAKFYIAELILALQHLHSHDIIYRDLKPEHILLDANGHIALCDFGLSKATLTENATTNTFCGDVEYLAPEVLLDEQKYTKVVDFWSLGVIVFEMCCGWSPFYAEDTQQMYKNIAFSKVRFPRDALSTEGRNFVKGLLNRNPKHRLGVARDAEELKDHPFFNDIDWVALAKKQIPPPFKPKLMSEIDASNFDPEFMDALANDGSSSLNARAAALASEPLSPTMQANFKGFTFVDESWNEEYMTDRIKEQYEDMDKGENHDDGWEDPLM